MAHRQMSKMLFIFVTSMQSSARLNPLARVEKMRGTECKSKKHTCLPPTFPFVRKAVKRVLQLRTDIERMTRTLNVHHQNTSPKVRLHLSLSLTPSHFNHHRD